MSPLLRRLLALLIGLPLIGLLLLLSDHPFAAPPGPPADAPRAIVALGDSTMSGEGGGDYLSGTDGQQGNWCHRSPEALVNHVTLPGVDKAFNFACSGVGAGALFLHDTAAGSEPSQAAQLGQIASKYRVVAIMVAVGANDDPNFGGLLTSCLQATFHSDSPGCGQQADSQWQSKISAMVPKVVRALRDVRQVMADNGYSTNAYSLVVQSYAAPVAPDVAKNLQNLSGCPIRTDDLTWVQDRGVPTLDAGIQEAAKQTGARYLDLAKAGVGHEACSHEANPSEEWFTRLTLNFQDLQDDARASHALQASFHPNPKGYTALGSCMSQFLASTENSAACVSDGKDGLQLGPAPNLATADVRAGQ